MQNLDVRLIFEISLAGINVLILGMTWKISAAVSELKAHIYEHFVTNRQLRQYMAQWRKGE